ncbi:MAG: UrcA family protein [Pseudomonadota bacterium]
MKTSFIAALALFAAPALAETPVEVEFTYDLAEVQSEADFVKLETSFRNQARSACAYAAPLTRATVVDHDCVEQAMDQAFKQLATTLDNARDVALNTVDGAQ